jgi:hypothetical protein
MAMQNLPDKELLKIGQDTVNTNRRLETDQNLAMLKAVIEIGQNAIRHAMFINGGAAVALLAVLGNLISKGDKSFAVTLSGAILPFSLGVLFAAMANGAAYFSQRAYHHRPDEPIGDNWTRISVGLVIAGYAAFLAGCLFAYFAFSK